MQFDFKPWPIFLPREVILVNLLLKTLWGTIFDLDKTYATIAFLV